MPQLIPDRIPLDEIRITLTDHTSHGFTDVTLRVDLTWADGVAAVPLRIQIPYGSLGDLPGELRDLIDGFLWGDGAVQVMDVCQHLDNSRQSRKVQRTHRSR